MCLEEVLTPGGGHREAFPVELDGSQVARMAERCDVDSGFSSEFHRVLRLVQLWVDRGILSAHEAGQLNFEIPSQLRESPSETLCLKAEEVKAITKLGWNGRRPITDLSML